MITQSLSCHEPWAWLLTNGYKLFEVRSTPMPKRIDTPTWVAIHASMSSDTISDGDLMIETAEMDDEIFSVWSNERFRRDERIFGFSEIVGAVRFAGSIAADASDDEFDAMGDLIVDRHDRCVKNISPTAFFSDEPGAHNWIVTDAIRFHRPIVSIGHLGIRTMSPILSRLVSEQFSHAINNGSLPWNFPLGTPIVYQWPKIAKARRVKVFGEAFA